MNSLIFQPQKTFLSLFLFFNIFFFVGSFILKDFMSYKKLIDEFDMSYNFEFEFEKVNFFQLAI